MKWGIVGFGSIAKRHCENLLKLGQDVYVVTKNIECPYFIVNTIEELVNSKKVERIIIANETSKHLSTYNEIRALSKKIPILIEKPLFDHFLSIPSDANSVVAYCLRFHPLVKKLTELVDVGDVIFARFYVGQYLPTWRQNRDYRQTYSAKKELGGGVLRDLSHEIDLAQFLFGELTLEFSKSLKLSNLEITSDDFFSGIFSSQICKSILIEMNYLDRIIQREILIQTNQQTIKLDLINGQININGKIEIFSFDKNEMYLSMLKNFEVLDLDNFSKMEDGLKVLNLIDKAERRE